MRHNIPYPLCRALLCMLCSLFSATAIAQADTTRLRTTANIVGLGSTDILDTYLSQEKFSSGGLTYLHITQTLRPDRRWTTIVQQEANFSVVSDRAELSDELEGSYGLYVGRYYTLKLPRQWRIEAGGLLNLTAGFIYNTSNSNNPAQARMAFNVMPSVVINHPFTLLNRHFTLRYELDVPLAGVTFSPNFGQSYYEIFSRGNYDHNIVPTTFVSAPNLRQQLSVDWQCTRSWALRIGYLGNYQQTAVNSLKQHIYNHRLLLGFVRTIK